MNNLKIRLLMVAALCCGAFFLTNCSSTTPTNSNTAVVTNTKPADSPKTTAPANTETAKTEPASTESFGVPECDDYVKKYEACLTKIAKDAPQAQPGLKTAFDGQRSAIKQAVSTPQGKSMMATQCKQYAETAKQATAAYACTW